MNYLAGFLFGWPLSSTARSACTAAERASWTEAQKAQWA